MGLHAADIEDVDGAAAQAGPLASTKQGGTKRKRAPAKKKDTAPAVLTAFDADIAESVRYSAATALQRMGPITIT